MSFVSVKWVFIRSVVVMVRSPVRRSVLMVMCRWLLVWIGVMVSAPASARMPVYGVKCLRMVVVRFFLFHGFFLVIVFLCGVLFPVVGYGG